tara:strand:+ start:194 stop:517 length:324 start_codon:yes stop_codon:yes gene_type:complete
VRKTLLIAILTQQIAKQILPRAWPIAEVAMKHASCLVRPLNAQPTAVSLLPASPALPIVTRMNPMGVKLTPVAARNAYACRVKQKLATMGTRPREALAAVKMANEPA